MSKLETAIAGAATALAMAGFAGLAEAATAHNSQAGAWGPSSHQCDATPYFPADPSCFPADLLNAPIEARDPPAPGQQHRKLVRPPGY